MKLPALRSWRTRKSTHTIRRMPRRSFLAMELLEDRIAPATITVNNASDVSVAGETSLREAIATANTDSAAGNSDTIVFDSSLSGATLKLMQGQLELRRGGTITIDGSSLSSPVTISGNNASRVFLIDSGAQAVLNRLNITAGAEPISNGGGIENNGTLTLSNAILSGNSAANAGGAIDNAGNLTASNVTMQSNSAAAGGGIANKGTATLSNAILSANSASTGSSTYSNGGMLTIQGNGWTNSGSMAAVSFATLNLNDNWTNTGTITVDATSTVSLGSPIALDPTVAAAANYKWTNSGTISIANGATLNLGGVFTADAFAQGLQPLGVTLDLSRYRVNLTGTLNNRPVDNPGSGGVLALSSATGQLSLGGGEIYRGRITTSGSNILIALLAKSTLDGVTLDGALDMASQSFAQIDVRGGLTLETDLFVSGVADQLTFSDSQPQTLAGTATLHLSGINATFRNNGAQPLTLASSLTLACDGNSTMEFVGGEIVNNGSIRVSNGCIVNESGDLTNSAGGTIAVAGGTLLLNQKWINAGTIAVDAASTIGLGSTVAVDPTLIAPGDYAWTNTGTISIANGATVNLGGVFTTDDFDNNLQARGVTVDLSRCTVNLTGTMDNLPADNTSSAGLLALSSTTGPLFLSGGEIYRGTITTSGSGTLVSIRGTLDGIVLNGNLDLSQSNATVTVSGAFTLNGAIHVSGTSALLDFSDQDPQVVNGTGTIFLTGDFASLYNDGNQTLTLAPTIAIMATAHGNAFSGAIINQGTIQVTASGSSLSVNRFTNNGTMSVSAGTTLTVAFPSTDYAQSGGTTTVDGTLVANNVNVTGGALAGSGTVRANVLNAGTVSPGDGTGTLSITGNYTQDPVGTLAIQLAGSSLFSQLAVGGTATLAGNLAVTLLGSFVPGPSDQFKVLTSAGVSGSFATTTGLGPYANGISLIPSLSPTNLTLAPQLPTLSIAPTLFPTAAAEGSSISVAWTVTNQSTTFPAAASWTDTVYLSTLSVLDASAIPLTSIGAPPISPLGPGASYSFTTSVSIPGNLAIGSYYLLFVADANGGQAVSDPAKLIVAEPLTLSAANLTVTSASAIPAPAYVGDALAVSWTVMNSGTEPADRSWQDAVYLSSTPTLTSSAHLLDTFAAPPNSPLIAGDSYTLDESVTVPVTASTGDQYLLFVPNSNGAQVVSSPSVYALPITLSAPQLTVGTVTAPTSGQFGQAITIAWGVTNAGTLPLAQDWSDQVFFSSKNTLDSTATLLATVSASAVIPLAANATYTPSALVTLPLTLTSTNGTYYLYVVADGLEQLAIPSRALAVSSPQPVAVTLPPLPDLTAADLSVPAVGYTGQKVLVSWTDTNHGTAPAIGPWVDNLFLASDAMGNGRVLVGQVTYFNALAVGETSVLLTQPIYLPSTPGSYYLVVLADAGGINEGPNSVDNTTVATTPLGDVAVPLPDLVVTSITSPSGVVSGTTVPITYTVANVGNAPTNAAQWYDAVFLSQSPDLSLTGNDFNDGFAILSQPLGVPVFAPNPTYLAPAQSYSQTVDVPFPVSASGSWYVYVVANRFLLHTIFDNLIEVGPVQESNPLNDLALSASFPVTPAPVPDLTVGPVGTPPTAFSGQPLTVSWTVTNNGVGLAIGQALPAQTPVAPNTPTLPADSTWTDKVFLSSDPTLDSSDIFLGAFTHAGALAPGATYTQSEAVTLPVAISGSFYLIVQTDVNGQVFENGSTANEVNATPAAIPVFLTPPPDLQTAIVSLPGTALASHALTFTYQVHNAGAGATQRYHPDDEWTDTYFLSPTATYNASTAISLGQQTYNDNLDAGASYLKTVTATLPDALAGTYYLIVNADSGNVVFELDTSKKIATSSGTIRISSAPADLIVSAASVPSAGPAGGAALVAWTVTNQGAGDTVATTWQDSVYANPGSTLSSSAVLLGSFIHTGLLNAGASYSQSQVVPLPISLSGPYHVFVVTNEPIPVPSQPLSPPPVYESNFNNDTSAPVPITIVQNLADLKVTSVTAPATVQTGSTVTIGWHVLNNGSGMSNSNYWFDDVWVSTHPALASGGSDVYLGTLQHSTPLAAGNSYTAALTVTVPASLAAGSYYFIVATDRPVLPPDNKPGLANLVYESNETNNQTDAPVTMLTPGPNLVVSNITAPATVIAGQSLSVGWTVTNNGAGATGAVAIQDSVYLSYDQVFSDSSIYVGSVMHNGVVAAGAHYTQTATLSLSTGLAGTFYVFVIADTNHRVFEQNPSDAIAYDSTAVQIVEPPLSDLVAGTVTIPVNAVAGQPISLTYQVTNNSPNPANGSWTDTLYLSPTPAWSINDVPLGSVFENRNLAAGASYTGTLTAPLPGVSPGSYYVILISNILGTLPEMTLANNLSASLTQTSISVPALTLGTAATGTLGEGQSAFYQVTVIAGQTLKIALDSMTATSLNELYVSFGAMPARGQADYTFPGLAAGQQITVPATQAGTYYLLAYGNLVPSPPEHYSLLASIVPFSVTAVSPATVGNAGPSTLQIEGAKFDRGTTFQLIGGGGKITRANAVYVRDASTAFATFDLTGIPTGTYGIQATQALGTTAVLPAALNITIGTGGHLETNISVPSHVLPGKLGTLTVNYENVGDSDLVIPLLTLVSPTDTAVGLTADDVDHASVTFLGTSANGPAGILRPGASASRTCYFQGPPTSGDPYSFQLEVLTSEETEPTDWDYVSQVLASDPGLITDWTTVYSQVQKQLGSTFGSLIQILGQDATLLPPTLGDPSDVGDVLGIEVAKAQAAINGSISGRLAANDLSIPLAGATIYAEGVTAQQTYATNALNDGSFIFPTVVPDTYTLSVDGALVVSGVAVTVPSNAPVTGVTVALSTGAEISGQVLTQTGNKPIVAATILAANEADGHQFFLTSDANGNYDFKGLPPGVYDLVVDAAGYARAVITGVDVTSSNAVETVTMSAESSLTGTIAPALGGPGESTVDILVQPAGKTDANQLYSTSSDVNTFALGGLPKNTYDVTINMAGYLPDSIAGVSVAAGQTVSLGTITLVPASAIDGTITSMDSSVNAAQLLVQALQGNTVVGSAVADSWGNFQITDLPAGTYTLALPDVSGAYVTAPMVPVVAGQTVTGVAIQIQPGGTISGTVTQTTTHHSIANVPVFLSGPGGASQTTQTDSNGNYQFSGLATGAYQVYLPIGGSATSQTVSVTRLDGTAVTANLQLAYVGVITGSLMDSMGNPITDGAVSLFDGGAGVVSATTDASGAYQFLIIQPGTYDLSATAPEGTFTLAAGVAVNAGSAITQNFQSGTATLTISVTDGSAAVAGDSVNLEAVVEGTLSELAQATVGLGGVASFANLAPGTYTIIASSPSGHVGQTTILVPAHSSTNTTVSLSAQATLAGTITDSSGNPISDATVIVQLASNLQQTYAAATLADGSYVVTGIAPGLYDVTVFADNYQAVTQTGLALSTAITLNEALNPSTTSVTGIVMDGSNNVVKGAVVTVLDSAGHILALTQVQVDGTFKVTSAVGSNLILNLYAGGYLPFSSRAFDARAGSSIVVNPVLSQPIAIDPSAFSPASLSAASYNLKFVDMVKNMASDVVEGKTYKPNKPVHTVEAGKNTCPDCAGPFAAVKKAANDVNYDFKQVMKWKAGIFKRGSELNNDFHFVGGIILTISDGAARFTVGVSKLFNVNTPLLPLQYKIAGLDAKLNTDLGKIANATTEEGIASTIKTLQQDVGLFAKEVASTAAQAPELALPLYLKFALGKLLSTLAGIVGQAAAQLAVYAVSMSQKAGDMQLFLDGALRPARKQWDKHLQVFITAQKKYQACLTQCGCMKTSKKPSSSSATMASTSADPGGWLGSMSEAGSAPAVTPAAAPGPTCPSPRPGSNKPKPGGSGRLGGGGDGTAGAPHDPNNIIGPAGFGSANFVPLGQALAYQIDFENVPTAGLPAQQVVITQQLDSSLNWESFRLGSFGFGGTTYTVPANTAFYETQIDLTKSNGFFVSVSGTIDERTGVATWVFTTIDPATGAIPADLALGFLPPDNANGVGEGFVSYTVMADPADATGTVIHAQATVTFYTQPPLDTPEIFNTIDAGTALVSTVAPLPANQTSPQFTVSWSGNAAAAGSAISGFTIYVSDNGGTFTPWLTDTPLTSAVYVGQRSHTYAFYSIASDNVGNQETTPTSAQATTFVPPGPLSEYIVTAMGSSTVQAGISFLVAVQAADAFGDPIANYSGPANVTLTISPTSSTSNLPSTLPINHSGLGLFLAKIMQTGSYTITAASGSFTGSTSTPVIVTAGPAVKLGFSAQPMNTPTGVILPAVTVQVLDLNGNVVTSDNTDSVTLGIANGPGSFTAGSTTTAIVNNGVATFNNLTLAKPGSYQLSAVVPSHYTGPYSSSFKVAPLQVLPGSFAGTPSGFSLQFNAPFLVNSLTPALYGQGFGATAPVPSVTLTQTRDGSGNPITPVTAEGSLVLDTASNTITFVETDTASIVSNSTPILPDGTYTVDVRSSGVTGFQGVNSGGGFLDGLGSGMAGSGDYKATFTVGAAAAGEDVLWVPATADGPGQPLSAPGANQTGGGYPIYLDDRTGTITKVQATLNYNPALLTVTGVTGPGFTLLGTSTPGHVVLQYSGAALPVGSQTPIGFVTATVAGGTAANPTPYRAKDLLHLSAVSLNSGAIPVVSGDGLHLVAYVADAIGLGTYYSSNDAVFITRVALQADTGFSAYPLVDPVIVADTDGSGFIPADAALQANEAGAGLPTANLANPPIPAGIFFQPIGNNVDPSVRIPSALHVAADGTVRVPVNIEDAHPEGSTGLTEAHLALTYDPLAFTVSAADIHLGSVLAAGNGWAITATIDPRTGQIGIALSSSTPIGSLIGGSLVTIDFHATASGSGAAAFELVAFATPNGQYFRTELEDSQGTFALSPAPTNGFDPWIDAMTIVAAIPGAVAASPPLVTPVEFGEPAGRMVDTLGTTDSVRSTPEDTSGPNLPSIAPRSSEQSSTGTQGALADTTIRPAFSVTASHPTATVVAAASSLVFPGAAPLAAQTVGLTFQLGWVPVVTMPGAGIGIGQPLADPVFQAPGRGTINPTLLATVSNVFERVLAGQVIFSPSGVDNVDYWEDMTRDLDGQGMAPAGHGTRRDETADPTGTTMVEHAAADPDALDRYFAELAEVGDQDTGDE